MNDSELHDLDALEAELRVLVRRLDPVPAAVDEAARAAFGWRSFDVELARLTYDSWDDRALVGIRGHDLRQLTFEAPGLTVEVEVGGGPAPTLVGQLAPVQGATVELRHRGGVATVIADGLGRFTLERLPSGPMSLRCRRAGAPAVETEWVPI